MINAVGIILQTNRQFLLKHLCLTLSTQNILNVKPSFFLEPLLQVLKF